MKNRVHLTCTPGSVGGSVGDHPGLPGPLAVARLFKNSKCRSGPPVVTKSVRALVQTGKLQPRADPACGLGPSEPRARVRGRIVGASSLRVHGCRDRNGQQNRDHLEPNARPTFHQPWARLPPSRIPARLGGNPAPTGASLEWFRVHAEKSFAGSTRELRRTIGKWRSST